MKPTLHLIRLATTRPIEFIDITSRVREALAASGVREGIVSVFTQHTTTAIKINERCDHLQQDMETLLSRLIPSGAYRHDGDTVDGRPNARGHLMSLLLGAGEAIPVSRGELGLGGWQSVFFVELDGPRPERTVVVKVLGE